MADSPLSDADSLSSAGASTEPLPGSDPAPISPAKRTSGPSRKNTGGARGGNESDSSLTEQDSSDNDLDLSEVAHGEGTRYPSGKGRASDGMLIDEDEEDMEPTPRAKPGQKRRAIDDDDDDDEDEEDHEDEDDEADGEDGPEQDVEDRILDQFGNQTRSSKNQLKAIMQAVEGTGAKMGPENEVDELSEISGDDEDRTALGQPPMKRLRRGGGPSLNGSIISSSTANGHVSRANSPDNSLSDFEDNAILVTSAAERQNQSLDELNSDLNDSDVPISKKNFGGAKGKGRGGMVRSRGTRGGAAKKAATGRGGATSQARSRSPSVRSESPLSVVSSSDGAALQDAAKDSDEANSDSGDYGYQTKGKPGRPALDYATGRSARGRGRGKSRYRAPRKSRGALSAASVSRSDSNRSSSGTPDLHDNLPLFNGNSTETTNLPDPSGLVELDTSEPAHLVDRLNDMAAGENRPSHEPVSADRAILDSPVQVEAKVQEMSKANDAREAAAAAGQEKRQQSDIGSSRDEETVALEGKSPKAKKEKEIEQEKHADKGQNKVGDRGKETNESKEKEEEKEQEAQKATAKEKEKEKEKGKVKQLEKEKEKDEKREPVKRVAPASAKKGVKKGGRKGKGKEKAVDPDALAADDDELANDSDHEEDTSDAVFMRKRGEAMEHLTKIEIHFAKLRDMLYVERMTEVEKDRVAIETGTHPELIHLTQLLELRRNKRLELAKAWLDGLESSYDRQYFSDEHAMWNQWQNKRAELRGRMLDDANSKRRRLDREKRALERPKDDSLASILAPRAPPAVPLHHRRRLGFDGEALVENEIAWALRNPDVRADPSLSGLDEADAYGDLERMGLREPIGHPGMYSYNPIYGSTSSHLSAFGDPRTAHLAAGYPYSAFDPATMTMQSHPYANMATATNPASSFASLPPLPGRDQPPSRPSSNPRHPNYPGEAGGHPSQHAYTAASNRIYPYSNYPDSMTAESMHTQHGSWPSKPTISGSFGFEDERRRTISAGGNLGTSESLDSIASSRQNGNDEALISSRPTENGGRTTPVGGNNPKARLTLDDHMSHRSPKAATTAIKATERAASGRNSPASFMAIPTIPPFDRHRHEMAIAAARANSPHPTPPPQSKTAQASLYPHASTSEQPQGQYPHHASTNPGAAQRAYI